MWDPARATDWELGVMQGDASSDFASQIRYDESQPRSDRGAVEYFTKRQGKQDLLYCGNTTDEQRQTLFTTNELLLAELHPVTQPLSLLRLTVLLLPTLQALLQHQQARTSAKETPTALPLRVATITILSSAPRNTHHIFLSQQQRNDTLNVWPTCETDSIDISHQLPTECGLTSLALM